MSTPPSDEEDPATHARVLALLSSAGVPHRLLTHAATRTSAESAAVRGVALASGAKAMLLKPGKPLAALGGAVWVLAVLSASHTADLKKLKALLGTSRLGMASVEEVRSVTGCVPGAVPPFGSLWGGSGVVTVVDESLRKQGPEINFNAALRSVSVCGLSVDHYLQLEKPALIADWSAAPTSEG